MSSTDLVSIVLPVYNGAQYIEDSIKSVLSQAYKNFELIVVDDSSTDESLSIIKSFAEKDKRIVVLENIKNLGLPASLNKGFSASKGSFLTWTSHDNNMLPEFIDSFVKEFSERGGVDFIYSDYFALNSKGERTQRVQLSAPEFLPARNVVGASFMYKRKVYQKVGDYSTDLILVEDYDYWLRCFLSFQFFYIPKPLYEYRFHEQSLTRSKQELILKQKKALRSKYAGQFKMKLRVQGLSWIYDWFLDKTNTQKAFKAFLGAFVAGDIALVELWKNKVKI